MFRSRKFDRQFSSRPSSHSLRQVPTRLSGWKLTIETSQTTLSRDKQLAMKLTVLIRRYWSWHNTFKSTMEDLVFGTRFFIELNFRFNWQANFLIKPTAQVDLLAPFTTKRHDRCDQRIDHPAAGWTASGARSMMIRFSEAHNNRPKILGV